MRDTHAIMRADRLRRAERDQQDIDEFMRAKGHVSTPKGVDPYHYSRSNRGVPSNGNRTYRNHDTSKYPRTRGVATAVTGALNDPTTAAVLIDGAPTVKVTRDGVTTFVPASTFTHARDTRTTRTRTTTTAPRAQTYDQRLAQLGAIGNVE